MFPIKCTWCGDLLGIHNDPQAKYVDFFCDEDCYNHYEGEEEEDEEEDE